MKEVNMFTITEGKILRIVGPVEHQHHVHNNETLSIKLRVRRLGQLGHPVRKDD
jgi:hypothetical protein